MKKLLNTALSRVVLGCLFMLVQIAALVVAVLVFQKYFVYFYAACVLLTVCVALYVLNGNDNPAYKIAWIVPIMLMPIFGGLFYLVFGRCRLSRHERAKMESVQRKYNEALQGCDSCIERLATVDADAARQSRYILNTAAVPLFGRTATEYLPLGEAMFERMVEQLKTAQKFIFLEYFIIERGTMWDTILAVLREKAAQGVEVRVLYDDFGCMLTLPDRYDKQLEAMGIQCSVFNRFRPALSGRFNNRDHRKICVVDGNVGFTGGINLADEYINAYEKHGHWLDSGVMLQGEAVWSLTVMFLSMWDYVRGVEESFAPFAPTEAFLSTVPTQGYVQPFTDTPLDDEAVGETVYLNLIHRAREYVYICTPYLIIDNEMTSALSTAAKSGVDVRIITPHVADKKFVHAITRSHYPALLAAGVKIYEYTPGFIHAKTFVCDDKYGVVGTINLDYRSLYLHYECAAWMYGTSCIATLRQCFEQTLQQSGAVTQVAAPRGLLRNLGLAVLRVFSPLL